MEKNYLLEQSTVIVGFAGSGKTTYLKKLIEKNSEKHFLILNDMFDFGEFRTNSNEYLVVDGFDSRSKQFQESFLKLLDNDKDVKFIVTMQEENRFKKLKNYAGNVVHL